MPLRNVSVLSIAVVASLLMTGCRDWRLSNESVEALSIEGRFGSEVDTIGDPELVHSLMDDDYTYLELSQYEATEGEVIVRIQYDDALFRWTAERAANAEVNETWVEVERVIDGERVVSEAPVVRVQLVSVENDEPEYSVTTKTDVYVYRVIAEWPDTGDRVDIEVQLNRDFVRDPPPSDDDDDYDYDDDDWDFLCTDDDYC